MSQELKEGDATGLSSDTAWGSRSKALWRGHRPPHGHQAPSRYAEQNPISWSPASENPSDSEIGKQTGEDLEFRVVGWPLVSAAQVQRGRNVMRQADTTPPRGQGEPGMVGTRYLQQFPEIPQASD